MYWISKFLIKIWGWKRKGDFPAKADKYILVAAPHTHWQDLVAGLMFKYHTGAKINWLGKASLFNGPFGFLFRWLGGVAVDRSKSNNKVDAVVDIFNSREKFSICIAPEGTRKKVDKLKSGFYHIARGANIPIVLCRINFGEKIMEFSDPILLGPDKEKEMETVLDHFRGIEGRIPEKSL